MRKESTQLASLFLAAALAANSALASSLTNFQGSKSTKNMQAFTENALAPQPALSQDVIPGTKKEVRAGFHLRHDAGAQLASSQHSLPAIDASASERFSERFGTAQSEILRFLELDPSVRIINYSVTNRSTKGTRSTVEEHQLEVEHAGQLQAVSFYSKRPAVMQAQIIDPYIKAFHDKDVQFGKLAADNFLGPAVKEIMVQGIPVLFSRPLPGRALARENWRDAGIIQQGSYVVGVAMALLTRLGILHKDLLRSLPGEHSLLALDHFFAEYIGGKLVFSGMLDFEMAALGTPGWLVSQVYAVQDALWNHIQIQRATGSPSIVPAVTRDQFRQWFNEGLSASRPANALYEAA